MPRHKHRAQIGDGELLHVHPADHILHDHVEWGPSYWTEDIDGQVPVGLNPKALAREFLASSVNVDVGVEQESLADDLERVFQDMINRGVFA